MILSLKISDVEDPPESPRNCLNYRNIHVRLSLEKEESIGWLQSYLNLKIKFKVEPKSLAIARERLFVLDEDNYCQLLFTLWFLPCMMQLKQRSMSFTEMSSLGICIREIVAHVTDF